jgi:hypothetical protein
MYQGWMIMFTYLYFESAIGWIKLGKIRWAENVTGIGEMKNVTRIGEMRNVTTIGEIHTKD